MFRNLYDGDVATWSPQGRLFQVEYAMEAVKQGAATVGICSSTHVVLCALKRSGGELASYQKKIFTIDDHIGVAIAGLTSDARVLSKYMQACALSSRMNMNRAIPVQRLVADISDRAQVNTQMNSGRPFGVGLLIAGFDETGAHLFEFSPNGVFSDYRAMAIGARSQSARTYLEKYIEDFDGVDLDALMLHALKALRDTLPSDSPTGLTLQNCSVAIVGKDTPFQILDESDKLKDLLAQLPGAPRQMEVEQPAAAGMEL